MTALRKALAADIVVAGGGFVGLATALALAGPADAASGLRVLVLDAAPGDAARGRDARASAITAASRRMLVRLGAWRGLDELCEPVREMRICDARLDEVAHVPRLEFDTAAGAEDGAPAALIIENRHLLAGLREAAARNAGVEIVAPARAVGHEAAAGAVTVACEDGRKLAARLLVAADGAGSRLRRAARIPTVEWDYDQWGLVATIRLELDHGGTAVQHFLPSGPFAALPLPGGRASLVWSERAEEAKRLVALDEASFIGELERRLGRRFGRLALEGEVQAFPLSFLVARSFVCERFALAGDAAHRFHPLAGQGVNLGFKDAAALAEVVLDAARIGQDIGSLAVLERYQRWRRFDAAELGAVTDGLNRLFSNDLDVVRFVRDAGLGLVDRLPVLKRAFVREAAGDTGTLPRLLRGEPA